MTARVHRLRGATGWRRLSEQGFSATGGLSLSLIFQPLWYQSPFPSDWSTES